MTIHNLGKPSTRLFAAEPRNERPNKQKRKPPVTVNTSGSKNHKKIEPRKKQSKPIFLKRIYNSHAAPFNMY